MTELEVLRRVRERFSDPARWQQGSFGDRGSACLVGAVMHAQGRDVYEDCCDGDLETDPALRCLVAHLGGENWLRVSGFNDMHSHAEVLALLDDVIAKLEEQEAGAPLPPLPVADPVLA